MNPNPDINLFTEVLTERDIQLEGDGAFDAFAKRLKARAGNPMGVLQALVTGPHMDAEVLARWNNQLIQAYRSADLCVLGGDTSSGDEFKVIATVLDEATPKK